MNLHLRDVNAELVVEWRGAFSGDSSVSIAEGNILDEARECLVSPANSYGYMDGGIDRVYRDFFGIKIERIVQDAIHRFTSSYLPVGDSLVVETGHERIPFMIVAPTMFLPEPIDAEDVYGAMKAVIRAAKRSQEHFTEVYCPGMGTGVGMVTPHQAAGAMAKAWQDFNTE